jgi:mersacidin/lichenicidin family type 2 lantibiotic
MNIEQIIQAWKSSEESTPLDAPENPIGNELSDQELTTVAGGMLCDDSDTCTVLNITCSANGTEI